jgi:hypothetical protein
MYRIRVNAAKGTQGLSRARRGCAWQNAIWRSRLDCSPIVHSGFARNSTRPVPAELDVVTAVSIHASSSRSSGVNLTDRPGVQRLRAETQRVAREEGISFDDAADRFSVIGCQMRVPRGSSLAYGS